MEMVAQWPIVQQRRKPRLLRASGWDSSQILAFIILAATAGLSAAAGMQEEEGEGAKAADAA